MSRVIGERIKHARRTAGMEQKELAKELMVSVGTISRWERGVSTPSKSELSAIAYYTNVSEHWLSSGEGPWNVVDSIASAQVTQESEGLTSNRIETHAGETNSSLPLLTPSQRILQNVMLDLDASKLSDDDAVRLALAIQEALRKAKP